MAAAVKKPSRKASSSEQCALAEKLEAGIASLKAGRVVSKPQYRRMMDEIVRKPVIKGKRGAR